LDETLKRSRADLASGHFVQAEISLKQGLALAGSSRAFLSWRRAYEDELRVVLRSQKAAELHQLADLVRFGDGLAPQPSDEANALLQRGREIWQARGLLLGPNAGRREPELDQRIRTDLLDIVTVWADLRVRLSSAALADHARREALAQLESAARVLGSGPALERQCRLYAKDLGLPAAADSAARKNLPPHTAWEHCDMGRAYLRDGELARATEHFQHAVDLRPQDFWPNFYQGLCAYKLNCFEDAVNTFRVCIALADHPAECYFNRALAYEALGRPDDAVRDYTRALECDDRLTGAALNRGLLHYAAGHYADAVADLNRALATASGHQVRTVIYYNRALVHLARDDQQPGLSDLKAAVDGGHAQARELHKRLTTPSDRRGD
jgi:tetratricopeptide (TPR) repeat protein